MDRSKEKRLGEGRAGEQRAPASERAGKRRSHSSRSSTQDSPVYQLFLMRHGIAEDRGSSAASEDAARQLTEKGKQKLQQIASALHGLDFEVDWIVTSPLVRAAQTAEVIAAALPAPVPVDSCAALRPGGSPEDVLSFLEQKSDRRKVLLVGHEPDLSYLAARLIGAGRQANLAFKKGGCCLIECEQSPGQSPGQLVWWLTPRLLRARK